MTPMTTTPPNPAKPRKVPRILIAGGGYVGLYTALQLQKMVGRDEMALVVVDPRPYMTYQPFLPEAAAGSIEARHVIAPLRRELKGATVLHGMVSDIKHAERKVTITPELEEPYTVTYDILVVALGAVVRTLPIPGLKEMGIGFKWVEEAAALHTAVLGKMDIAASTWDEEKRKRLLTFVFVGGGFAGVEAIGEVEDMARAACKGYDSITPEDLRFVLVEAMPKILPELDEEMGSYAVEQLRSRGIEVKLSTRLESCVDGLIKLSSGEEFEADTLVWTAGVRPNPVIADSDLPIDPTNGKVRCLPTLQVVNEDGTIVHEAWSAGDCASVPDLAVGGDAKCPPTAQHAVRQAKHLGKNIVRTLRSQEPLPYMHKNKGTVASLGLGKGVASVMGGIKLKGWPAWFMHRAYHMWAMPTMNRKVRIVADWLGGTLFEREMVALGGLEDPRESFVQAANIPARKPKPVPEGVPEPTAMAEPKAQAEATAKAEAEVPVEAQKGLGI
jgi:NADH dehydrogenase